MAGLRRQHSGQYELLGHDIAREFDFAAVRKRLITRAESRANDEARIAFARASATAVTISYWEKLSCKSANLLPIRLNPVPTIEVADQTFTEYADACATLSLPEAFFQIGELYTALLPAEFRMQHGVFYTPPALACRLLDILESQGVDWAKVRVLDPACGGAAFAAYIAQRMLAANRPLSPEDRLRDLSERLVGIDVDPFATWLSAVLLDAVCLPILGAAKRRFDGVVRLGDTLADNPQELGLFDLVVGNPPYGKVRLNSAQRRRFARSLYGHANLYGMFTDLAVSVTKPGGLIGFVTPTSFLGGEYFKNLRRYLCSEAIPLHAGFVADREGVFSDVLQETMLAVFRRKSGTDKTAKTKPVQIQVEEISSANSRTIRVDPLGTIRVTSANGEPWIIPRRRGQVPLVRQLARMDARLADYGYRVATGQLVWNRHKDQFCNVPGENCYPVLWAECIQSDGTFVFRAANRNHHPYIHVLDSQTFLVNTEPCVLVQRTTSKEQSRRLVAAMIPNSFVVEQPGYVVENHVNMLIPTNTKPTVSLGILTRLLNSTTVDHAFRCISGSVAVSAYELESLPLPHPSELTTRVRQSRGAISDHDFERAVQNLYHDV